MTIIFNVLFPIHKHNFLIKRFRGFQNIVVATYALFFFSITLTGQPKLHLLQENLLQVNGIFWLSLRKVDSFP